MEPVTTPPKHRVVIIGGGFGGLYAAQSLNRADVEVTLIDKRNFHLFQPLLYQVATGTLSPADISSPLRSVLSRQKNARVLMEEAIDIDPENHQVVTRRGTIPYDSLIVATGASHHYFGNDQWKDDAPGLKTVEDAVEMRRRIFSAFEAAEKETDPEKRRALLTFMVVGAGPTGVEIAGAIAELAKETLKNDFRSIDTTEAQILLVEGLDRVLPPYPADLSVKAAESLEKLGVTVRTKTKVINIDGETVTLEYNDEREVISAKTIIWAAGVKASGVGRVISDRTGASLDRAGRVMVEPDMSVPNHPNIFVIGDLAHWADSEGKPLPGIAPVAMQAGKFVAKLIKARVESKALPVFKYQDLGSLAVIAQNKAVANVGGFHLSGFIAWFIWIVAHVYFLIEFDNKLVVMIQWAWNYITRARGARIITGGVPAPIEAPPARPRQETPVEV
ncbi:MAG: NAD(P)/FAD-dependent oxidoreductase [Leptolyngbya sp. UWPOB_LEPTO1]|uniref:NAD(P)/FAD-dependent oxidoreductase n=1 Tax=Leptolyngbya sp. UWPOB_LEPTO1 TaxID=2815653 RepID=UPI001ACC9007|nr:NAD(P)/FAD-dependent oxidoreductase [Leptolyngbya sp. UWPOB_LEPTO1]MBN8561145.1 NAD(P)/FAD-dependent oxidoreductase [Leptolyngbya sp. UWPOB_LEPTO1]